jgi:phosphoadenosine phosphosulfate reductase
MLIVSDLFGDTDIEAIAIQRLRTFEPKEGYILCNSYGKDSCTIEHLAIKACVKFESHHSHTGLDAPELVRFGRSAFPSTIVHPPLETIEQLIIKKGVPPTRRAAYCCQFLKENLPCSSGRRVILGVRWAESVKRSGRRPVETCFNDSTKTYINPIVEWSDEKLWEYIKAENIDYCAGYDTGRKRYGCIGCPKMGAKKMIEEFTEYPKYYDRFMRIFEKAWPVTHRMSQRTGKPRKLIFNSAQQMMDWWLNEKTHEGDPDQTIMFE